VTKKPDEFSDTTGSACKGCNAGGQPFNERLPHALIIMASPSAKTQFQNLPALLVPADPAAAGYASCGVNLKFCRSQDTPAFQ